MIRGQGSAWYFRTIGAFVLPAAHAACGAGSAGEPPPWTEPPPLAPSLGAARTAPSSSAAADIAASPPLPITWVGEEGLSVSTWGSAEVSRPLPLVARLSIGATDVLIRYRAPAAPEWRSLQLVARDGVFEGLIACGELDVGTLRYFAVARDVWGVPVATAGSRQAPLTTEIVARVDGPSPALPGRPPPPRCTETAEPGWRDP